jgi:hypothetical protein
MKSVNLFNELTIEEEALLAGGEGVKIEVNQSNEVKTKGGSRNRVNTSNNVSFNIG